MERCDQDTIDRRAEGFVPGMTSSRDLNIVLAIPGKNAGLSDAGNRTNVKTVHYTGAPLEVKFAE